MSRTDNYKEIFSSRGSSYDDAMRLAPDARREEFMAVIEDLSDLPAGTVLDVPAGGGYLERYLPSQFNYRAHEPVAAFNPATRNQSSSDLLPIPLESASVDAIVSIAGVHHITDKGEVFVEMARVVKDNGLLVLADAHCDSPVAGFLDGYIDRNNSTGHTGHYLDDNTVEQLRDCGWRVETARRKFYQWCFEDTRQMARYCHLMFDITHSDLDSTRRCLEAELGITERSGVVGMNWDLFVVRARRLP